MKQKPKKTEEVNKDIKDVEEEIVVDQEAEIAAMKNKADEYLESWKRAQADFENYKRMQAESQKDLIRYASQNVILQLIPVLDNFHMSTDHIPEDQKDGGWVVGIMHIQKQLEQVLAENGIEEIPAKVGDLFDPRLHEAISTEKNEIHPVKSAKGGPAEREFNRVKKVVLKGYKMGEKVIRPARVVVE